MFIDAETNSFSVNFRFGMILRDKKISLFRSKNKTDALLS